MIAAIFQARMASTRLPGKVLMDICGNPLIWHVIQRVKAATAIDQIIIATTAAPADDPLRRYLTDQGIKVFLGSESDVLDRFYQAAQYFKADVIVRITPDDPFKDPEVIDRAVRLLKDANPPVEYVSNCSYDGSIPATYPEGLDIEVMTFDCLSKLWQRSTQPSEREHVTPYLFSHPEEFTILGFRHSEDLSHLRWTIDYEKDMAFAREIYGRLYERKPLFLMEDILEALRGEPHLSQLNSGVIRYEGYLKSLNVDS